MTIQRTVKVALAPALAVSVLAACGSADEAPSTAATGGSEEELKVAVLAASAQNGYNQAVYEGVVEGAEELGVAVDATLLDGQFDANTQLSQLQNAATSGQYDGIIVVPHDGPSLTAAFPLSGDLPVVTVLNPVGPDIDEMEPQVEGVVSTVATPPSDAARKQAEQVVDYCAEIDPCEVGLLVGILGSPLDVARADAYNAVLGEHDNIEVVGTVEGNYDRDQSLTAVSNLLQANPDLNAILSNADQQTFGAQLALENAGIDPSSVFLTGGGGTTEAIQAVRDGKWTSDYINFPVSMGTAALEQVLAAVNGEEITSWVDADTLGPLDPFAYAEDLEAVPDFTGEWNG